jgi:hypothetical protein
VSYPQLQQDSNSDTVQLLRVIANNTAGYTILGGQLVNSTASNSAPSPLFQPSPAAIRVNVLWFASLVISLSVASLGILVKQWLRAYMAFASSSPQGQLRIRHFRRSGLEDWKVFEIASALPLLLQLSLCLFFVGLCYFTIDIHPVIGHTTLPLVCAWAFLIVTVTFSPIFSSRCPYKTPALSSFTGFVRVRIYLPLAAALVEYTPLVTATLRKCIMIGFLFVVCSIGRLATAILVTLSRNAELPQESLRQSKTDSLSSAVSSPWLIDTFTAPRPPEESDVLKDPTVDLDILVAVDAVQANDELLGTTVKAALEQSNPDWSRVVDFLAGTIGNRIPWLDSEHANNDQSLVNTASLSRRFTESAMDIFVSHIAPSSKQIFSSFRLDDRSRLVSAKRAVSVFVAISESTGTLNSRFSANLHHFFAEWLTISSHDNTWQRENRRLIWRCVLPVACKMYEDEGSDTLEKKLELLSLVFESMHAVSDDPQDGFTQTRTILEHKRELWLPLNDSKRRLIRDTAISLLRHITMQSSPVNSSILHSIIVNLCGTARVNLQYDMDALRGSVHGALSKSTKMDWDIPAIKTVLQSWISQHPDYVSVYCGVKDVCWMIDEFSPGIPLMVNEQNIETFVSAIEETADSVRELTQAVNLCLVALECRRMMGHHPAFYHGRPRRPTFKILASMLHLLKSHQKWPQEGVPITYPDYMNLAKRAVELITMIDILSSQASYVPNGIKRRVGSVWGDSGFRLIFAEFCGAQLYYSILWKTKTKLRRIYSHLK